MIKIGDRVVVQGIEFPAYVEKIEYEPQYHHTILFLDWKEHGKSRVFLHDENKIWYKYSDAN